MRNVKILAWIHILTALPTLLVALFFCTMVVGSAETDERIMGLLIGSLLMVKAVTSLALGWGLLRWRPWAYLLGMIVSVLHLPFIPIGTAIGLFGMIVLQDHKHQLAAGVPPRAYPAPGHPAGEWPPREYPAGEYPVDGRTGVSWQ